MRRILIAAMCCCVLTVWHPRSNDAGELVSGSAQDPEELVTRIYDEVSRAGVAAPDWSAVRTRFHPHAVIGLRVSRDETGLMGVDEFIQGLEAFNDRIGSEVEFSETANFTTTMVYGNAAHCSVVCEAALVGSQRPPQRGLDSWQLMFRRRLWRVVSVVNESEVAVGPVSASVFGD